MLVSWGEIVLNYLGISSSSITNSLTLSLEGTWQEAETFLSVEFAEGFIRGTGQDV